ncbi:MAG: hypothetical protein LRY55_10400 [Leadbetterella sp.]|nr:hypothetical protein [Leadbetterella sp.]
MEVTVTINGNTKKRQSLISFLLEIAKDDDGIIVKKSEADAQKKEFLSSFKRSVEETVEINKGLKKGRHYKTMEI